MRAERLIAILLMLQVDSRVTAADLAAELEVSVTTVRRDLEALSAAGIPVYAERGRAGGWSIFGSARINLSGLTRGEAEALFLQLGPVASAGPDGQAALRKLLRTLPEPLRSASESASAMIHVDRGHWGEQPGRESGQLPRLREAMLSHRTVEITYVDRAGRGSKRTVDPLGLVDKNGTWYLVASTADGRRTFRLDRVTGVHATQTPSARPTDTDLARLWQQIVDEVEILRGGERATIRVCAAHIAALRSQFGRHCEVIGTEADGRVRAIVAGPSEEVVAQDLAGWGADIEVLEPASVRSELARIGRDLVHQYGTERGLG